MSLCASHFSSAEASEALQESVYARCFYAHSHKVAWQRKGGEQPAWKEGQLRLARGQIISENALRTPKNCLKIWNINSQISKAERQGLLLTNVL